MHELVIGPENLAAPPAAIMNYNIIDMNYNIFDNTRSKEDVNSFQASFK